MRFWYLDRRGTVRGVYDNIVSFIKVISSEEFFESFKLRKGIAKILLVGSGEMRKDSRQFRIRMFVDQFYNFLCPAGVRTASAHARLDIDMYIQRIIAAIQNRVDHFDRIYRSNHTVQLVFNALVYVAGGLLRTYRGQDQDRLTLGHFINEQGFVDACYRKKIDISVSQNIDYLRDTMSVRIGLNHGTEFRIAAAQTP
jgi:hypothetical protein